MRLLKHIGIALVSALAFAQLAAGQEAVEEAAAQSADLQSADVQVTAAADGDTLANVAAQATAGQNAEEEQNADGEELNVQEVIFGHINDSYEWHITNIGKKSIAIHLPVIVRSSTGWHVFSSKRLEDGQQYEGLYISEETDKVVENIDGEEVRPFDISITKNVFAMFISSLVLLILILSTSRWYRKHDVLTEAPTGVAAVMEPLVQMIDEGVVKDSIGEGYEKFSPYLCTAFFWILTNNLLGIVPFFPGGANVTGNIAVTCVLGLCTFFVINLFGTKHYFKDIFWPDVPWWLKAPIPLMPVIEIFSALMKPVTLAIRLFANMLAGHITALSLVCIIFLFAKYNAVLFGGMTFVSVLFGVFMDILEVLVAFLQAYVFTMLSAVFIGIARQQAE